MAREAPTTQVGEPETPAPWWPPGAYAEVHLDVVGCGSWDGRQDVFDSAHLAHRHGSCAKRSFHSERRQLRGIPEKSASTRCHQSPAWVPGNLALCVTQGELLSSDRSNPSPIAQMGKLRAREALWFVQGHTVCPWWHQGKNPGFLTLTALCLGFPHPGTELGGKGGGTEASRGQECTVGTSQCGTGEWRGRLWHA